MTFWKFETNLLGLDSRILANTFGEKEFDHKEKPLQKYGRKN